MPTPGPVEDKAKALQILSHLKNPWWTILIVVLPTLATLIGTCQEYQSNQLDLEGKQTELEAQRIELERKASTLEDQTKENSDTIVESLENTRDLLLQEMISLEERVGSLEKLGETYGERFTRVEELTLPEEELLRLRAKEVFGIKNADNLDISLLKELLTAVSDPQKKEKKKSIRAKAAELPELDLPEQKRVF